MLTYNNGGGGGGCLARFKLVARAGRRRQPAELGVRGGKVKIPGLVLDTMTGDVQQQEVAWTALGEEVVDCPVDHIIRFIEQRPDLEATDLRVPEDPSERLCIVDRSPQLA
jgi:hypothetical protein